jgi:hypothetical protein
MISTYPDNYDTKAPHVAATWAGKSQLHLYKASTEKN